MDDKTPLEQVQDQSQHNADNISASHETTREDKSPLERAQEQKQANSQNLSAAREESLEAHSHTREEQNVDRQTDAPGSIGKSGDAPNPRTQPTRQNG